MQIIPTRPVTWAHALPWTPSQGSCSIAPPVQKATCRGRIGDEKSESGGTLKARPPPSATAPHSLADLVNLTHLQSSSQGYAPDAMPALAKRPSVQAFHCLCAPCAPLYTNHQAKVGSSYDRYDSRHPWNLTCVSIAARRPACLLACMLACVLDTSTFTTDGNVAKESPVLLPCSVSN
eukprot:1137420-Pelagomonas_calceolata.AAC.4